MTWPVMFPGLRFQGQRGVAGAVDDEGRHAAVGDVEVGGGGSRGRLAQHQPTQRRHQRDQLPLPGWDIRYSETSPGPTRPIPETRRRARSANLRRITCPCLLTRAGLRTTVPRTLDLEET